MKTLRKLKAVSPVIATLLLIAIAVAAGIILYVFVSGFVQSLTTANPAQAGENLAMTAYDWANTAADLQVTLRNTGPAPLKIVQILINNIDVTNEGGTTWDGVVLNSGQETSNNVDTTGVTGLTVRVGQSYVLQFKTDSGAVFQFTVIAGRRG